MPPHFPSHLLKPLCFLKACFVSYRHTHVRSVPATLTLSLSHTLHASYDHLRMHFAWAAHTLSDPIAHIGLPSGVSGVPQNPALSLSTRTQQEPVCTCCSLVSPKGPLALSGRCGPSLSNLPILLPICSRYRWGESGWSRLISSADGG